MRAHILVREVLAFSPALLTDEHPLHDWSPSSALMSSVSLET